MFRRTLSLLLTLALFMTVIPQAGFALSAEEALFGGSSSDTTQSTGGTNDAAQPAGGQDDALEGEEDIYGSNDTSSSTQYPTLQLGDQDASDGVAYIVFLQNRLIELGYLRDTADGTFGENTQTAVQAFQKNNGLPETGIADAATQTKLFSDTSALVTAAPDSTMFGSETTRVQTMLAQWGFLAGSIDGKYGDNTASAIQEFKQYMMALDPNYGATPTPVPTATPEPSIGVFGEMPVVIDIPLPTQSTAVADGTIDDALLAYVDGDRAFQVYRQTVKNGDSGVEVKRVQTRLKQLNYLYSADGEFGALTQYALMYFQNKHGLTQSGVADEATQEMLFSAKALESEEYVFPYKIVIDISDQRVYVGKWTGAAYTDLVKTMKCSTGKNATPTPTGVYQAGGKAGGEWYYFKDFNCYAKWAYRIVGGILFHSVVYSSSKKLVRSSVSNLGRKASHGCVRLTVEDAKWIYDNCPTGTTVYIRK